MMLLPLTVMRRLALAGLVALFAACGGGAGGGETAPTAPTLPTTPTAPADSANLQVLMMGNSHTSVNGLPDTLSRMLRGGPPVRTVNTVVAPGILFLDERLTDPASLNLLRGQAWSVVVLQAQKYSQSGLFSYSTAEAEQLVRLARQAKALPVLFPEWPRKGVDETTRIYDLHVSIAKKEPACVAPIGQAWDLAASRFPALQLHDADGNHAAPAGAYLAALVLYATVTGASPQDVTTAAQAGVDATVQANLKQVASDTVQAFAPRQHCPADKLL